MKWTHTLIYVRIKSDEPTPHLEDWVESTVGSGDRRVSFVKEEAKIFKGMRTKGFAIRRSSNQILS